jgi:carbon-monoxide dehydrogenase medium subunit
MQFKGKARIIAGGTDLVLLQQAGEINTDHLVDITQIPTLRKIHEDEKCIHIGAAATHEMVAGSGVIQHFASGLATAANEVGSPQIRTAATIGGNVVNAQPAADTALALISLGAKAAIVSARGTRYEYVSDLFIEPGVSKINPAQEILTSFEIHKPTIHFGSAYRRLGKCKSIALPVVCAAAAVQLDETGKFFSDSRIVIGPVAPTPLIAEKASEWLKNKPVSETSIETAARIAQNSAHPRNSILRCSAEYREAMVAVLVKDVLENAVHFILSHVDKASAHKILD